MKLALAACFFAIFTAVVSSAASSWYNRVAYQDMDPIWDDDAPSREYNMNQAVNHVVAQGVNTVYIQAYVDTDTHTNVQQMYYPTNQFGTPQGPRSASNAFATFAAKFKAQGLKVGAWMPISAFRPVTVNGQPPEMVMALNSSGQAVAQDCDNASFYCKLALWNPANRAWVIQLYQDLLTAYPQLDLINFHDDGAYDEGTDVSPSALAAYAAAGFPGTALEVFHLKENSWDSFRMLQFALFKSTAISAFTGEIMTALRLVKPSLLSSRNYFANAFLLADDLSVKWFSQDCASALQHTDYIAPMIFPYMENETPQGSAKTKFDWYFTKAYNAMKACNPSMEKVQLCLQSVNWHYTAGQSGYVIGANEFEQWISKGLSLGFYHVGYYPSSHYSDAKSPNVTTTLATLMSTANHPSHP